jgi:Tfp pilus assembly protein PilZ
MSDIDLYSHYFPVGKKVGVGIPLPSSGVFRDWAVIHEIDEDLVSLQLSRDVLPEDVSLHYGQILELRGGSEGSAFCCRAIVVSEGEVRELLLRLIGEVVSDELREFYRIDAFLPIKYFVSHEQNIDLLRTQWEERRTRRRPLEINHTDHRWSGGLLPAESGEREQPQHSLTTDRGEAADDLDLAVKEMSDSWDTIIPLAATISGGGLRINTHQEFEAGEYVRFEIFVPLPPRVIDVIGRVVFITSNLPAGSDREYFNTGVQFVYIDERDRDAIIRYISTIQLKRIRQLRERYLYRGLEGNVRSYDTSRMAGIRRSVSRLIMLLLFVLLLVLLASYSWYYVHEHPKTEIQRIFEEGIEKYRERLRQK